jgi:hypothetical protein
VGIGRKKDLLAGLMEDAPDLLAGQIQDVVQDAENRVRGVRGQDSAPDELAPVELSGREGRQLVFWNTEQKSAQGLGGIAVVNAGKREQQGAGVTAARHDCEDDGNFRDDPREVSGARCGHAEKRKGNRQRI